MFRFFSLRKRSVARRLMRVAGVLLMAATVLGAPHEARAFNQYMLETLLPRGAQKGTTVEVTLYGNYLEHPRELVSNRGGIRAVSFEEPKPTTERHFMMPSANPQILRAKLEVASDCPLGRHLLFLRTDRFLSAPVLFEVGELPVLKEAENRVGENDEPAKAQSVPRQCTVHGQIQADPKSPDRDCYSVEARKGERLSFDLLGVRAASMHYQGENDCQLRLFGPDGRLLAACDDTPLYVQDPFLSVEAPADGRYVIEVSQHPGALFTKFAHYLLHVGTFPSPEVVYPAGGRPGEKLEVQLLGDVRAGLRQTLELPAASSLPSPITYFDFHPVDGGGRTPSALPMRVTEHPNVMESEPNDTGESAKAFQFPAALNGVIGSEGDLDVWRFHAEKGEVVDVRVYARSLGTPLDPKIWIRPVGGASAEGKALASSDDSTMAERGYFSHTVLAKDALDPALSFVAKEAGDYLLGIEDTRGLGGAHSVYRIEVQAHRDQFCVYPSRPRRPASYDWSTRETALQVPRGGRWTVNLNLGEGLGTQFGNESFVLEAVGLPAGVTMESPVITPSKASKEFPVQFQATAEAKPGVSFIQVVARPVKGERAMDCFCQRGFVFSNRRGGLGWMPVWMEGFALAVVEEAPFRLELERPGAGLVRAGNLELVVKIHRKPGWNEALQLKLDYLPSGVEQGTPVEVAAGQTEARLPIKANADAPLHSWKVCVSGTSLGGDALLGTGCRLVSSALVDLPVTQPYVTLDLARASVRRGAVGEITAKLKQLKPFTGVARASLIGLPFGVKLLEPYPEISAKDQTCTFRIEATAEALLGQYKQIQAELSVPEGGEVVRQQTGSGVLRVDPASAASSTQKP
ncbi:MAG: hypothetical protein RLZZ244_2529 [Verrucomicrobiota bacterium]